MMVVAVETTPAFRLGEPETLFAAPYLALLSPGPQSRPWDVSPADGRFLMIKNTTPEDPARPPVVTVVLDWFQELAERVPIQ